MKSKLVGSEIKTYADGSKTVEDSYMKPNGEIFVNTYNVSADESMHDHLIYEESGKCKVGHEEMSKSWEDRDRDPNSTFYTKEEK